MGSGVKVRALPFTFVVHALAIASSAMVIIWCIRFKGGLAWHSKNKGLIFNIHPILMLIGFIILGGEAIISYKALPWKKEVNKLIHLVLHMIASILGIVGIYVSFKFHNESSIPNLYSLHSWLGIGVICLYAIQWIYGLAIFYYPGVSRELKSESLPWHVFFGLFVFLLAVANAAIGFLEKLTFLQKADVARYGIEAILVNFTAVVTILYGTFVVLSVVSQGRKGENLPNQSP